MMELLSYVINLISSESIFLRSILEINGIKCQNPTTSWSGFNLQICIVIYAAPILYIPVPQTGHFPLSAGLPFFMVTF